MNNKKMFYEILQLIDENPYKKWSLNEIATFFHYSPYHFHRLIKEIFGETFQKLISRRRLSYSAQELISESNQILDVALQYEYRSHEAFSRAFKNTLHLTPSTFRENQTSYHFFERNLLFSPHSKSQNPLLKTLPAFSHAGIKTPQNQIGETWGQLIKELDVGNYHTLIGIVGHHDQEYIAGVHLSTENEVKLHKVTDIPSSLYVSMAHYGSYETIIETYRYLHQTWLPPTKFYYNENQPEIEIYEKNKPVTICIPIEEVETK